MTRFQLVFRENGVDRIETHDNNVAGEPVIDGKLIVDGEVYVIRGGVRDQRSRMAAHRRPHRRHEEVPLHARRATRRGLI